MLATKFATTYVLIGRAGEVWRTEYFVRKICVLFSDFENETMISDSGYILELNVVSFIYAMFIFILKSEVKLFNFLLWWKLLILLCTLPIFYCRRLHSIPGRSWMFDGDTQCTNHQLELAMKDVFLADAAFKEFDKVLLEMYLVTHDKVKQLLKSIAMRLNVMYVAFVKSDGTRFQNHKYRAIKALIIKFQCLCWWKTA